MARILILEDEISLSAYWRQLLEEEGHQVFCCSTVPKAIETASSTNPDLIVADMMIKEQGRFVDSGGITLLSKRVTGDLPAIPIIGVSGYKPQIRHLSMSALEIAKTMGVDLALYKPIAPATLLTAIDTLLNKAKDS